MGHQPINNDLTIEITIRHKDKQFPGVYFLKKEEQTWDTLLKLTAHIGAVIRQTLRKNNIILSPHDGDKYHKINAL